MMENVLIKGDADFPLDGILVLPDQLTEKVPAVVLVQGSGPSDRDETVGANKPFLDIANGLAEMGIASIRYDKRTLIYGEKMVEKASEITVNEETIQDALFASRLLKDDPRIDADRIFIVGHSLGGMLAPRIDAEGGDFAGLVIIGGTSRDLDEVIIDQNYEMLNEQYPDLPDHSNDQVREAALGQIEALKIFFDSLNDMTEEVAKQTVVVGTIYAWYLKEMKQHTVERYLADHTKPVLVIQGEDDVHVSVEKDFNRYREMLKNNSNATFKLYPGLNHIFMKTIYGTIDRILEEYDIPQHVEGEVIEDIGNWILSVKR